MALNDCPQWLNTRTYRIPFETTRKEMIGRAIRTIKTTSRNAGACRGASFDLEMRVTTPLSSSAESA